MMSVFGWLVTYLIHSSILLSLAWIADRFFLRGRPHIKELVWRVALIGGIVTATAQAVLPWRPYAGTLSLGHLEPLKKHSLASDSARRTIVIRDMGDPRVVLISRERGALLDVPQPAMRVFPWRGALAAWGVGTVVLLGALGLSWRSLRRRLEGRRRLEAHPVGDILCSGTSGIAGHSGRFGGRR